MLITPRPSLSRAKKSFTSSAGCPKKWSAPWFSSVKSDRWITPILCVVMLPYLVVYLSLFSLTYCKTARKSFKSIKAKFSSFATAKAIARLPSCASDSPSIIERTSGPTASTVALTGWPSVPYKSQNRTGKDLASKPSTLILSNLFWILSFTSPSTAVPAKSPFTSAKNTGTPASEKLSAITFKVMVLPEPDAPVINPCRFAICGKIESSLPSSVFPIKSRLLANIKTPLFFILPRYRQKQCYN